MGNFTPFISKSFQIQDNFFTFLFSTDSENFKSFDIGLWEVGTKRHLNRVNKSKKIRKNFFLPRHFYTLYEQTFSNLRPFLFINFPQGFRISNNSGSGSKKTVKRYLKSEQTDRRTGGRIGVHFEGSIIPRGALWRLQNSAGQRLTANLPRLVLEPWKCAPQSFGAM